MIPWAENDEDFDNMERERNRVEERCSIERLRGPDSAGLPDPEGRLPKIRQMDIREFDRELAAPRWDNKPEAPELSAYNLSQAVWLGSPLTLQRKCARTYFGVMGRRCYRVPVFSLDLEALTRWAMRAYELLRPRDIDLGTYMTLNLLAMYNEQVHGATQTVVQCHGKAAEAAEHLRSAPEEVTRRLSVMSLIDAARAAKGMGDYIGAEAWLEKAAQRFGHTVADRKWTKPRALWCSTYADVCHAVGKSEKAYEHQAEAVELFRALSVDEVTPPAELGTALARRGILELEAQRWQDAIGSFEQAFAAFRQRPDHEVKYLLMELDPHLRRLHKELKGTALKRRVTKLQKDIFDRWGAEAAAMAGDETTGAVFRSLFELSETSAEALDGNYVRSLQPAERRLLNLLNLGRKEVADLLSEYEEDLKVCNCLPDFLVITGLVDPAKARAILQRYITFLRCVLTLQAMAESICAGKCKAGDAGELQFPDITFRDAALLRKTVAKMDYLKRDDIVWREAGAQELSHALDPASPEYRAGQADEKVVIRVGSLEPLYEWTEPPDYRRLWEAFQLLVKAAGSRTRPLRECSMPVGIEHHWDYILGERNEDAPKCERFYIAVRGAETCGRPVCKQNLTRLRDRDRELGERVYSIAKREWRQAGMPGIFLSRWEAAQGNTPQDRLACFRDGLRQTRLKDRR